jgi:hypothetical protein
MLPELEELDLVTLGLPLGPRKKFLKAIAALREGAIQSPDDESLGAPPAPVVGWPRR